MDVLVVYPRVGDRPSAGRFGPALFLIAGITALFVTAAAFAFPDVAQAGKSAYLVSGVVMSFVDFAVALGIGVVFASAPVALGRLRSAILTLTVGASIGMVLAEIALRIDFATGTAMYSVVGPLQALGLIGLGIGIVRARGWTSWRRFVVLGWGLYVPMIMVPLLAASGGTSLVALAGYHVGVVATGIAARTEFDRLRR
jgi:hypothetical protein